MPANKDLKRIVRDRMSKTGEAYTAARARVLAQRRPREDTARFAVVAGMSDEAVRAKTGRTWAAWVRALDAVDAASRPHREIAAQLKAGHGLTGWWSQTVTVGYERIRGLREVGQRRGGAYEAHKSKTFHVALSRLYAAFATKRERERWLTDVEPTVRSSTKNRSVNLDWPGGTSVHCWFTGKGPRKSQVALQHAGLPDRAAIERRKAYWAEALERLGAVLRR